MEYLPEKKRTQQAQVRKKEEKLKNFRKFLADKEVVLALTKCKFFLQIYQNLNIILTRLFPNLDLLSVRSQKQWPEDPNQHLVDYFGQYRDPLWDRMAEWQEEMDAMRYEIPDLQTKVE